MSVLFWGHWYPCFGFLVTSLPGFKVRVGSALFAFVGIHSLRSTSGATPVNLLMASMVAGCFPRCVFQQRWELAQDQTINDPHRRVMRYHWWNLF